MSRMTHRLKLWMLYISKAHPRRNSSRKNPSLLSRIRQMDFEGRERETRPYWGVAHRHVDFTAQELTVARFHFQVGDFGDSIPSTSSLMGSAGNTVNVERIQCTAALGSWPFSATSRGGGPQYPTEGACPWCPRRCGAWN